MSNSVQSRSQSHSRTIPSPFMPMDAAPSAKTEEDIYDVGVVLQPDVLTPPWSPVRRHSRPHTLPSATITLKRTTPTFAIPSNQNTYTSNISQNVPPILNSVSGHSRSNSSPFTHDARLHNTPLESTPLPSFPNSPHHGSLNISTPSPRTYPVFQSTTDLAVHHGIPRKFPPIPRTHNHRPPVPRFDEPAPPPESPQPNSPQHYFQNLMSNYLDMVSKNPDEAPSVEIASANPHSAMDVSVDDSTAAQHIVDSFFATPEWNDFLTSPFDESPLDNVLETPAQGSADLGEYLTSPAVADLWNHDSSFGDLPLFPPSNEPGLDVSKMTVSTLRPPTSTPNLDGLIQMSPSFTPALDPHTLFPSSPLPANSSNPPSTRPTKKVPTGTRKNISPESLVPIEAPTQPRSYVTPSVTSRKELPAVFAKKRARSMAFDEEDELAEEPLDPNALPPTATEAEAIAAKRRQNTLAARRSRKRKLEYQRQLEDAVEVERREKEVWKERALMCQSQLLTMGVSVPFNDDV